MSLAAIEALVGHPREKWEELKAAVQAEAIRDFARVEPNWLDLMWTLDTYRVAQLAPRGLKDIGALNRGKGNWFAELLALLLQNRTNQPISPRQSIQGFSQDHQIDIAWPARAVDPLVCCETKVTGAPGYGSTPARGAMSDFSNRRKEIKFAATDLKLYRRQKETAIEHWDVWRQREPPKTFFLWAARLDPGRRDRLGALVREARILVNTYLDGAGIVAWQPVAGAKGYRALSLPQDARVPTLDDVLYRIASEINRAVSETGKPPDPVRPDRRVVQPDESS